MFTWNIVLKNWTLKIPIREGDWVLSDVSKYPQIILHEKLESLFSKTLFYVFSVTLFHFFKLHLNIEEKVVLLLKKQTFSRCLSGDKLGLLIDKPII